MVIYTILFTADEHASKTKYKARAPSPFRSPINNVIDTDNDLFVNPESIVTIMVESPKEPPNSDFGMSFSSPPLPKLDDSDISVATTDANVHDTSDVSVSNVIVEDIRQPIDVNTPRDTTNIFYAYEETDASVSDPQITIEQSLTVDSTQINSNVSQVNNQPCESTADHTEFTDNVVADVAHATTDAMSTVNSDSSSSSSS